jgi:hypothetical protein
MKLYHGGLAAVETPRIIRCDLGRDFGFAFYTTDIREQAERWALRRRKTALRNGDVTARAVVSVFEFDDVAARKQLDFLDFPKTSLEWLELVISCRSNLLFSHGKDVVTGKIANDSVGETVAYVLNGIMRKEDALERLKFQKINNQLAFCSDRALLFLKYESCYTVEKIND